jgi:helicase
LAILTSESFDSKTRSATYREWLEQLACIVTDEAHLLGDKSRGAAAEAALMRASQINTSARLILLSATMSNALAIAKWVKSLNGKETKCVTSTWRPTVMEKKYYAVDMSEKVCKAVQIASRDTSKKTVIFVHSKITGAEIAKTLKQAGVRCAFHNASVSSAKRTKIEKLFSDGMSGLNILVSTSTLSSGVNIG